MVLAGFKIVILKIFFVKNSICDDSDVNAGKTWMNGDWFYITKYGVFGDGEKAAKRFPRDILMQWIITQSKGFTRKHIEKISRYIRVSKCLSSSHFSNPGKIKYSR